MSTLHLGALPVLTLAMAFAACSDKSAIQAASSQRQQMTNENDASICKLFTAREIASALGADVERGHTSGPLGSGCSWQITGQDRSVMIQIVPRDYWEDGTGQPGGEALEGIGEKAFVGPWLDDHRAGALTAQGALYVMSPVKATSVALLRDLVDRTR